MKWIIEFFNGKQFIEGKDNWDVSNIYAIKRIYFKNKNNIFGFYVNGNFFINNKIFDFKININNDIIPFQYKTGILQFSNVLNNNNIIAWNIGYKILCDFNYEYTMVIKNNHDIFFKAIKRDLQNNIINIKEIKLQ